MNEAERVHVRLLGHEPHARAYDVDAASRFPDCWRARIYAAHPMDCAFASRAMSSVVNALGTAKGVVFISLEDETGISNAIVNRALRTSASADYPGSFPDHRRSRAAERRHDSHPRRADGASPCRRHGWRRITRLSLSPQAGDPRCKHPFLSRNFIIIIDLR